MSELARRRAETVKRVDTLRVRLADSEKLISGVACVYATGSFGRGEAGSDSDLDLFIVSKMKDDADGAGIKESRLRRLDEICLKADLIKSTRDLGIKEFDGDGRYLVHYTADDLKSNLGSPEDDALNTFTARLLLLLESAPLLGGEIYQDIVDDIIAAYWQDFEDHQDDFVPAFLTNDILRLWRTFCVNYEVRTEREPTEKNIKRRQKNYTLKHSRLLTCFSSLLHLLGIYELRKTVNPDDVKEIVHMTPTERLEWILTVPAFSRASGSVRGILDKYDKFLAAKSNAELFRKMFETSESTKENMKKSHEFSSLFFEAIELVGNRNRLHKLMLV